MKNINQILDQVLSDIRPPKEDTDLINLAMKNILGEVKKNISKKKIKADVFVGGSFAKDTLIKKDYYDIDVFIRFDKQYKDKELSDLLETVLRSMDDVSRIHGSRDYFRIKVAENLFIELIPVRKISKPQEAENITDMSYSHVKYIRSKLKSDKIKNDVRIAKAFCYATGTYGAESYIKGFSGYAIELLVHHYKGFVNMLKAIVKHKIKSGEKIVIDIEKDYKNKQMVLMDLNSAKLSSPIILIDPTYPQRNALAALSDETLDRFQKEAKKFLKTPKLASFEIKEIDLNSIKNQAKKSKLEFVELSATTNKQEGDIAGTKLQKFHRHLKDQVERYFTIKKDGFGYGGKQDAVMFFTLKSKGEITQDGPFVKDKKSVAAFKKNHKKTFVKGNRIYSKDKINFSAKEFFKNWVKNNQKRMNEMSIEKLSVQK